MDILNPSRSRGGCGRTAIVLTAFAAVFLLLTVSSYTRKSATDDEPVHVTTGYAAWKLHDYRIHPETPPLLRLWADLPLLAMRGVRLETNSLAWAQADKWGFSHEFLYRQNDADRLLYPARFMIVLLGVLLGVLLFCWARELFGFAVATVVLGLYALEPNILAHSSLATTDVGAACFIFGTLYFLWRTTRRITVGNLFGLFLFCALAQASKTTALLLFPVAGLLLAIRLGQRQSWRCEIGPVRELVGAGRKAAAAVLLGVGLVGASYAAIWAVYGFRFTPTPAAAPVFQLDDVPGVRETCPRLAPVVGWLDRHRVLPNAFSQGFLMEQARGSNLMFYFAGQVRQGKLWYYFPVAFLVKTPLALLLLFVAGVGVGLWRGAPTRLDAVYILVPVAVGMLAATQALLNVGLRHLLAVYPFVILAAGAAIAPLVARYRLALVVALAGYLIEVVWIYPDYLAYFNWAAGGPRHGPDLLVDSNIDWGQDLKPLKLWMDRHRVEHINLSYFGTADPAYYGISCTYLPRAPFFARSLVTKPRLPGYVAVSVTNLRMLQVTDWGRRLYGPLLARPPDAVIGWSIYIYWVGDGGP